MAVVSADHADPDLYAEHLHSTGGLGPRIVSPEMLEQHSGAESTRFWAVVDGFVVDATEFLDSHPGGLRKLLATDKPSSGATGQQFGFSFSRGRNAHFPQTGQRFRDGVERFMMGGAADQEGHLPPVEVDFAPHGKLLIIGRLGSG